MTVLTHSQNGEFNGALWDLNNCDNFEMTLFEGFEEVTSLSETSIKLNQGRGYLKNLQRLKTGSEEDSIEADFNDTVNNRKMNWG